MMKPMTPIAAAFSARDVDLSPCSPARVVFDHRRVRSRVSRLTRRSDCGTAMIASRSKMIQTGFSDGAAIKPTTAMAAKKAAAQAVAVTRLAVGWCFCGSLNGSLPPVAFGW